MPILMMSNKDAEDAENESDQNSFAFHKEKGGLPRMAEQGGERIGGYQTLPRLHYYLSDFMDHCWLRVFRQDKFSIL